MASIAVGLTWSLALSVPSAAAAGAAAGAAVVSASCPRGCRSCSEVNGCLSCEQRYFFFLERKGMRQQGRCTAACPQGHYEQREPSINRCAKCKVDHCSSCFARSFCTKCTSGYYLHLGKCSSTCPDGFAVDSQSMECINVVECEVGPWSEWGPCMKNGKPCGGKRGTHHRERAVAREPSPHGRPCPAVRESKRCRLQHRQCAKKEGPASETASRKPQERKEVDHRGRGKKKNGQRKKNRKGVTARPPATSKET
ncbi:R-spondin-3-like [Petromyzon marinus]|uniref:R-spondin-3-like n=1 Tax=Petromyzon marinus TaxID=7757 RepID=UPI003F718BB4